MHNRRLQKPDGRLLQMSASCSRLPCLSRAMTTMVSQPLCEEPLAVEYIGGSARWRFQEPEESPRPKRNVGVAPETSSCQQNLHAVTLAAGWGEKSRREKKVAQIVTRLGYCPGLTRKRGHNESLLHTFLPPHMKAGAFNDYASGERSPARPKHSSLSNSSSVLVETRDNLRVLELPPHGQQLVVKRWRAGFFEKPPRIKPSSVSDVATTLPPSLLASRQDADGQEPETFDCKLDGLDAALEAERIPKEIVEFGGAGGLVEERKASEAGPGEVPGPEVAVRFQGEIVSLPGESLPEADRTPTPT
eukprot:TRINITY_DN110348_c0_g1_i1.p1 TRINITY_DN110348_c0_g1~~TRINITY_DN110348_c0_g1_i1.p1  ORF type:complete len:304 (-),score=61.64 TRINITY_DN110348_c0_g1_i1:100-1011(-)